MLPGYISDLRDLSEQNTHSSLLIPSAEDNKVLSLCQEDLVGNRSVAFYHSMGGGLLSCGLSHVVYIRASWQCNKGIPWLYLMSRALSRYWVQCYNHNSVSPWSIGTVVAGVLGS